MSATTNPSGRAAVTGMEAGIVTADAERLARFYTDGLGFTEGAVLQFPQGTVHRLHLGDARCKIFQPARGADAAPPSDPWHQYGGFRYAALLVTDAEDVVARARRAGATVLTDVVSHRPGARYALIADPDGNVLEILEE